MGNLIGPYVKVGPTTFEVEVVKGLEQDGVKLLGYIDERTGKLLLEEDQCQDSMWNTIWHEITHIILRRSSGTDIEAEAFTNYLAYAITEILIDNCWLTDGYEVSVYLRNNL